MKGIRILAPAKVNLGLAILGKRADGYHEIDTIMVMIDLADAITVRKSDSGSIVIHGMADVSVESNLMTKAIRIWCAMTDVEPYFEVSIQKRIPSPAGLGGGSSDAAAVLKALNAMHDNTLAPGELHELAKAIGADCPFFLGTACSRAQGIGTDLKPLPSPSGWMVVVIPPAKILAKTATLYASLQPQDYGSHEQIDAIEHAITSRLPSDLPNSFQSPAFAAFPELSAAAKVLEETAGRWALSGAGPAIYVVTPDKSRADSWLITLRHQLPAGYFVVKSAFLDKGPVPVHIP